MRNVVAGAASAAVALATLTGPLTPRTAASAAAPGTDPMGVAVPASVAGGTALGARAGRIRWKPCPTSDRVEKGRLKGLECGRLTVPTDHDRPDGDTITLALSRLRHTARGFQGVVLLNRGGPGAHGRDMPRLLTAGLPKKVVATYDWIGFDPRGVGASKPAMVCDKSYQNPGRPRPETVPASPAAEQAWQKRARAYAADCAKRYGRLLPHMGSVSWARDLEAIRVALGQEKINFFGYSYGTYLGAVYATMFPDRVRRMVLDSVVRPSGVWYDNNLDQNVAFEKRIRAYFAWIARHHKTYKLGRSAKAVGAAYAKARRKLRAKPAGGRVGPAELDDLFLADGYADYDWPDHARLLSALIVKHDPRPLAKAWHAPDWLEQNNYAVYNAVQCRDAAWPRDWARWHRDNWRLYRRGYRFETWSNAWYNAPCAFWAHPGGPAPVVQGGEKLPLLLVQATEDAATPYRGAVETHRRFRGSRLLVQVGGGNHGVALGGDRCIDKAVAAYLRDGSLPRRRPGPDASCPAGKPPEPGRAAERRRPAGEPVETDRWRTS
ncbi:alpha/beta hydrolase [Actinomadura fulvescens]|uniref:Alpha/beta hydrolase n=1 Tax=Actinomadura fulvescens TaxID=46160 RepID=A0ABN3P9G5_9ACTN